MIRDPKLSGLREGGVIWVCNHPGRFSTKSVCDGLEEVVALSMEYVFAGSPSPVLMVLVAPESLKRREIWTKLAAGDPESPRRSAPGGSLVVTGAMGLDQ